VLRPNTKEFARNNYAFEAQILIVGGNGAIAYPGNWGKNTGIYVVYPGLLIP